MQRGAWIEALLWPGCGDRYGVRETLRQLVAGQSSWIWRKHMEQAKAIPDLVVVKHEEGKTSEPEAGLKRRVLAYNEKLFIAEHEMVKGWTGTAHSHPHDQIV
jgi:hypothetical protein